MSGPAAAAASSHGQGVLVRLTTSDQRPTWKLGAVRPLHHSTSAAPPRRQPVSTPPIATSSRRGLGRGNTAAPHAGRVS